MGAKGKLRRNFSTVAVAISSLLAAGFCARGQTQSTRPSVVKRLDGTEKHTNADLEMAKIYAQLGNWAEAESHYVLAARDPLSQEEALAGLATARRRLNAEKQDNDGAAIQAGKIYRDRDLPEKAEEIYRSVAVNPGVGESTRQKANLLLADAVEAQRWDRGWSRFKENVEAGGWFLAGLIGLLLAGAAVRAVLRRRRVILFHEFKAPTDEIVRGLDVNFKYARATMRYPALSPAGAMPPSLAARLFTFDDENEPIEDIELAGVTIPFASIARIFGEPAIQVTGGFDGISPSGSAFAVIATRGREEILRERAVRVGVPREQRLDLLDFAYDVLVQAFSAYADI